MVHSTLRYKISEMSSMPLFHVEKTALSFSERSLDGT